MRANLRLAAASLASLAALLALPAGAQAGDQWAFRQPLPRPTEDSNPKRSEYAVPEAPRSPACAGGFCVHWVAEGIDAPSPGDRNGAADGDGVPDYVERVLAVAAHVRTVENGKLGWRRPRSDGRRGGLEVTFAHEYCHILQMGYDAYQDAWMAESTAVWMEDQAYNGIDDYLRYVRRWVLLFRTPLTANSIREYGGTVWNEWLARRYGREIVRNAWARALYARPGGFSVASYDAAIQAAGGSGISRDFARFARDVAEWRTATVINADTQAEGFSARRLDWNYLTDTAPFRVRARSVR